jgi:general secretion pathway protein A
MVIFSQLEILEEIERNSGFKERINLLYIIKPLTRDDTRRMISYRLQKAGLDEGRRLFTSAAVDIIYHHTQGYPRKIILLCQEAIEELIVQEKPEVDEEMMESIIRRRKDMHSLLDEYREKMERERQQEREEEAAMEMLIQRSDDWSLGSDLEHEFQAEFPGEEREKKGRTRKKKGLFGWLLQR